MIYLVPECASALGDDTFWTWAQREFPNSVMGAPINVTKDDAILQYSTMGASKFPEHTIALLWELYPEMKAMKVDLGGVDGRIATINECCATAARRVVASSLMVPYYEQSGKHIDVIPLAVDTDLFRPYDKTAMRAKYGIPTDRKVGFWSGTEHPMKGFDQMKVYAAQHPEIFWIVVWTHPWSRGNFPGYPNFGSVPQCQLSELMSCADFYLSCSRLRPFYMTEWEAMACNLPMTIPSGIQKDFVPSANPRDDIFRLGWDRASAKKTWLNYIADFIASKQ